MPLAPRLALESPPRPPTLRRISPDETSHAVGEGGGALLCVRCGRVITTLAARLDQAGRHQHTFVNPHGFVFRIGCFATAAGCIASGAPSAAHTWFPGHSWQVAVCRGCDEHLGWRFLGPSRFHGLILDRLTESGERRD